LRYMQTRPATVPGFSSAPRDTLHDGFFNREN
jgi:hypothetical protein